MRTLNPRVVANGQALDDLGVVPINLTAWLSAPQPTFAVVAPVGFMGLVPSVQGIQYSARKLALGYRIKGAADMAAARAQLDQVYQALQGRLELGIVDAPDKVIYGVLEESVGDVEGVKLSSRSLISAGTITCHDPFWYRRGPTPFGGAAGTRVVIPCGTAPSKLRLQAIGPYANPVFILRDRGGNELDRMPFVDSAPDDSIFLDLRFANTQIDRYVAGVRSAVNNGYDLLDAAYSFFGMDPRDGATLEITSGSFAGLALEASLT